MNCRVRYIAGKRKGQEAVVTEGAGIALQNSGEAQIVQRTDDGLTGPSVGRIRVPAEKSGEDMETKDEES